MLDRFRRLTGEIGTANALLYLVDRVLTALSGGRARLFRYYLVVQPVAERPRLPPHRGASIVVTPVAADDPRTADFPRPEPVLRFRYDQGGLALSAYLDDQFVGCLWLNLGPYLERSEERV